MEIKLSEEYHNLSKQAKYVLISSSTMLVLSTLLLLSKKNKIPSNVVFLLLKYLLTIVVNVYLVNCMIKGKCEKFAWYSVFVLFIGQFAVLLTILKN